MEQLRILVVDDEAAVCEIFQQFLEPLGFTVRASLSGEQAVEQYKLFSPHFVFLDVILPGTNGIQVLRQILDIDSTANVVMISGMHDLSVAKEAMMIGAMDYITKPIEFPQLMRYLRDQVRELFGSEALNLLKEM